MHTAAQLRDELTAALDRLSLPEVRRKELDALRDAAGDIADQLAFIGENYYVLASDDGTDPAGDARAASEATPPAPTGQRPASDGPLVPVKEVDRRVDLRDVAAQVFGSDEFRAAMAEQSLAFPLRLLSVRPILVELSPVLVATEWFPAFSLTLRWALVGTDFQLGNDEVHGLCIGRRGSLVSPVDDLTHQDLASPELIAKVLGRHDLAFGDVAVIDYLRWLASDRSPSLPANGNDLIGVYAAETGRQPRSVLKAARTLATTGVATFHDGTFDLSDRNADPALAVQVVRRHVDDVLAAHHWPDVTAVVDALTGIRRT